MKSFTVQTQIAADGKLCFDLSTDLPAGPAEVVIVVHPDSPTEARITSVLKEISFEGPKHVAPNKSTALRLQKKLLVIGGGALAALALLAGHAISLKTKEGTLMVSVNQSDATMQVLSNDGHIEITRKGENGPTTMALVPGKHRLKVEKNGFELFTTDFEIGSGSKTSISATLVPAKDD